MRCLIPSINFKVLGKAIGTLSRIGDELYVEPHTDGIYFRTINADKSAFATFNFSQSFFSFYNVHATTSEQTNNHNITSRTGVSITENVDELTPTKCKVAMKSVLAVFKTPANLVESAQMQLEPDGKQLVFQLRCRHSIRKTYYVPVIECETVQAVYNKDMVPNRFCAQSRVLAEVLQNFHHTHEQISLSVSPTRIFFRNYSDGVEDSRRAAVRTELCLEPLEFDSLTVGADTTVTFSCRELRALLQFAEATSLPVAAHFEITGRPVIFSISSLPTFEANFVLATMTNQMGDSQSQNTSQASSTEQSSICSTPKGRKRPISAVNQNADMGSSNQIAEINTEEEQYDLQEVLAVEQDLDATISAHPQKCKAGTPETLKAQRFFFPRCFRDTQAEQEEPYPPPVILAPDSDPDDEIT